MKVAVMNYSGNVGKTVVARHVLEPRMKDTAVLAVESINSDGTEDEALKGKQFAQLSQALLLSDSLIVDVGSSNIEELMKQMESYDDSVNDFDLFVIPTIPHNKQVADTISTIEALNEMGVKPKNIRVMFNQVDRDETLERQFAPLFKYYQAEKKFVLNPDAVMYENEIYSRLKDNVTPINVIASDETDYKALAIAAENDSDKLEHTGKLLTKRLAVKVSTELDDAYKAIVKK